MSNHTGGSASTPLDFDGINRAALANMRSLVERLIPGGRIESGEYVVRNPTRNDQHPGSFKINVRTGAWADFACGDKGGDPISLVAYVCRDKSQGTAARRLADMVGFHIDGDRPRSKPNGKNPEKKVYKWDSPPVFDDELRRHLYRKDGAVVRVKVKKKDGNWVNWYRVEGGWKSEQPSSYVHLPYFMKDLNPFDPEVLNDELHWTEGERDADTLAKFSLLAFTFGGAGPGGKGDGLPAAAAQYIKGRHVVIHADDGKPGEDHAQAKAKFAQDNGASSVRVVRYPGLDDVTRWLADHTPEELAEHISGAPLWQPRPSGEGHNSGLDEWDAGDDPGPIPPREWLLGNQFCRKFTSSIVATRGTGKSALRLLQFISLALGQSLTGQHVFRRCRVLLISLEDDRWELQRRIDAVLRHYKIDRAELKDWLFCATPRLVKLAEVTDKGRSLGPLERWVRDAIARRRPDIVSLDPFVKTHGLEENSSTDMDFVCDLLARMSIEHNIAVDSPHHTRKGSSTPGDADAGRGSSGIKDAGRLVYTLTPMSSDEAAAFGVPDEDRELYVRLDSAKVNIVRRGGKPAWFKLVGVRLNNGTSEYPNGDEVQTVEPWIPPDTFEGLSDAALNAALTEIDKGLPNGQRYSSSGAAKDRAAWPVVQKHCSTKTEPQCRQIVNAWVRTKLLYDKEYDDPVERKKRKGLHVDDAKRPGTRT
jgi:hypothetical protein